MTVKRRKAFDGFDPTTSSMLPPIVPLDHTASYLTWNFKIKCTVLKTTGNSPNTPIPSRLGIDTDSFLDLVIRICNINSITLTLMNVQQVKKGNICFKIY